ncbi:hypothetical protein, unlikely [Trypanosoma brucei gambiense DAL972]|uniref:Uncharacterized protein n=1 Tax=Trypanosoma brucei gambiense (strain MHOM/CI/86/DAL972) TaxID=679716 RepID=C9ZSU0_TRYB9|nr:hypothetical protein, unlikely [Trypanosoma brucei gambiense DAL972]CBH12475.1 hypothetical protein, unlikely [Trypanosoma brucei gambiense DAL972]|eukprot:XP_011774755.1 hypothetical protein, unlikely [Trypanosoma brucei gambiense DAL972]
MEEPVFSLVASSWRKSSFSLFFPLLLHLLYNYLYIYIYIRIVSHTCVEGRYRMNREGACTFFRWGKCLIPMSSFCMFCPSEKRGDYNRLWNCASHSSLTF